VEEYQQWLKKSLLSPRTLSGSKTAYLNVEKEAYWALAVLQTRCLFGVRNLPTEDNE
jgi:hypothetical protein